ncbi:hypothetical protein ABFX02_10G018750 [Erythranthe guttata]
MKAARTSVLSSRWTNLWKHTPSLDFDTDQSLLDRFYYEDELLESEKRKYVKWVNSVIKSHESRTLKEFRIRFHLDRSSRKTITRWLQFAFSRQVERLELDIQNYSCSTKYYCFTEKLLTLKSGCIHDDPRRMLFKSSLKALVFKSVLLNDGAIDLILHNCPLLEQLIVHGSREISKLEVCGSYLKLKHLEIAGCPLLKSLKVSAPRLTTLIVLLNFKRLLLENVPMLVNVSVICHSDCVSIKRIFDVVLSCCISQLQTLCLGLYNTLPGDDNSGEINELPKMPKLKKLVIEYDGSGHECLSRLATFISLSPYLEEFVLQFRWFKLPREDRQVKDAIIRSTHHHLKIFKFCGYYGATNDAELIKYILENCGALEKITVDPYFVWSGDKLVEETARKNAKQKLAPQVPQHVELVIL